MKKYLDRLKFGVSNSSFPLYAQYVKFIDNKIITCNDEAYVSVDMPTEFDGSVNFFVLEEFLRKTSDDAKMKQKKNTLVISDGHLRTSLPVLQFKTPILPNTHPEKVYITEGIYDVLMLASKFTGDGLYSSICVEGNSVYSTNIHRLFHTTLPHLVLKELLGLDKKVLSFIKVGDYIGIDKNKIIVDFKDGYAIFTMNNISRYPTEKMDVFISDSTKNVRKLCSVQQIQLPCQQLSPIFFGEQESEVSIINKGKKALIVAESLINGRAEIEIETELDEEYSINIDSSFFKGIPSDFDVFIGDRKNILSLKDSKSMVFLVGTNL